jgi:hypothetical protein
MLDITICTKNVCGGILFSNSATSGEWHLYEDYQSVNDYYKSWSIAPDPSLETSTYWKWFMVTFSKDLAEYYDAKEPEIPSSWKNHSFREVKEQLRQQYKL